MASSADEDSRLSLSTKPDSETAYTLPMTAPETGDSDPVDHSDEDRENDEAWFDSHSDGSTSVAPSVYCHESAHGRQYHRFRSGRYPLPNDEEEMAREHLRHHILQQVLEGHLFLADIGENPQRIIDLGTGSGIWVIDAAEQFPRAQVIGTDLSPVQPTWVPINARMLLDDIDEPEWSHGSSYDLVHLRDMKCAIRDMDEVLGQIYTNLKVGGWVEFQDFLPFFYCTDDSSRENDPLASFVDQAIRGMREFDCHWFDKEPADLEDAMDRAGFTNFRSVTYNVPIGQWMRDRRSRDIGALMQIYVADTCDVFGAKPLAALGLTDEERRELVANAKDSLRDWTMHRYLKLSVCYAQKGPGTPSDEVPSP